MPGSQPQCAEPGPALRASACEAAHVATATRLKGSWGAPAERYTPLECMGFPRPRGDVPAVAGAACRASCDLPGTLPAAADDRTLDNFSIAVPRTKSAPARTVGADFERITAPGSSAGAGEAAHRWIRPNCRSCPEGRQKILGDRLTRNCTRTRPKRTAGHAGIWYEHTQIVVRSSRYL